MLLKKTLTSSVANCVKSRYRPEEYIHLSPVYDYDNVLSKPEILTLTKCRTLKLANILILSYLCGSLNNCGRH